MKKIDNENIFLQKLRNGINLFLGAGFSLLPSPSGKELPKTSELLNEICEKFSINKSYSNDIEKVASVLKRNNSADFQIYLREKYRVDDYNLLYDAINMMSISNIITTNIDNLIPSIIEKSQRYYLSNVTYYGPTKKDGQSINYVPLHGDVLLPESDLVFGKFELSSIDDQNKGLFSMMHGELLKYPTLFWGYAFHDGSVNKVLNYVLKESKQEIWVQLMPGDSNIEYFRDLGVNIIISSTEDLLKYINCKLASNLSCENNTDKLDNSFWKNYCIPTLNSKSVLVEPDTAFYENGKTSWYFTLSEVAYMTSWVNQVINTSLEPENKNVIIVGLPFSGKTTLLMQVACKFGSQVYYVDDLSEAKAKLICNNCDSKNNVTILIDNCAEDIRAYKVLADCPNIRTIATSDDFLFESSSHLLKETKYKKILIDDISKPEAKRIFDQIPSSIKKENFIYKNKDSDKYSFFELMSNNIKNIITEKKIRDMLERVKTANVDAFELILLTAYLSVYRSALTTDIIIKYFNDSEYQSIKQRIKVVNTYVSELIEEDLVDQDYYFLRTALFAKIAHEVALKKYTEDYGKIVLQFLEKVQPNFIYKYYVFKRKAYDSNFFYRLFGTNADQVYKIVYINDPSAYTLQQWALYKMRCSRYEEAFIDINKALNLLPNNLSLKNSRAIILFEANKNKNYSEAKPYLKESMDILSSCYTCDKRKEYHLSKYQEFAIYLKTKYGDDSYIHSAIEWAQELYDDENTRNERVKRWLNNLKKYSS